MDIISNIQQCFQDDLVYYTHHSKAEMKIEEYGRIHEYEVFESIMSGVIIEEYQNQKPYPSFLIYGMTKNERPIHVVCAYDETVPRAIIITVYQPNPELWINFKKRK